MNIFLAVLYFLIGIAGLVFKNNVGVFVGLSLFPWQMIKLLKGKTINLGVIIISGIIGAVFFALQKEWLIMALFLFIQTYNYLAYYKVSKDEGENDLDE